MGGVVRKREKSGYCTHPVPQAASSNGNVSAESMTSSPTGQAWYGSRILLTPMPKHPGPTLFSLWPSSQCVASLWVASLPPIWLLSSSVHIHPLYRQFLVLSFLWFITLREFCLFPVVPNLSFGFFSPSLVWPGEARVTCSTKLS